MRAPFREIPSVGPQVWPEGVNPQSLRFLVSESTPKWTVTGRSLRGVAPPIGLHEAVALDLRLISDELSGVQQRLVRELLA